MTDTTEFWDEVNGKLSSIIDNELEIQALLDAIATMDDEPVTSVEEDNDIFLSLSPEEIAYLTNLVIDLED